MNAHGKLRKLLTLLLAAAMILSLSACGGGGNSGGGESGGSGGGSAALEVKIWDNVQLPGLRQIAEEWTAQSGIPVNIQVVTWDDYWTLLEAGASGGQMPDVFWMHSNNAQMYMENNKLLNLSPYIEASDAIDLSNYYEGITALYSLDGNQYAVPKDHDTIALIYNKTLFDAAGVDYPTNDRTWEDYYEAGKAITEAGKDASPQFYGAAMNTTNDQDGYFNIIYDYGGYVISDDHKTSGWDNPNTKAAMEFVGRLNTDVFAPQTLVAENGTDGLFTNDLAAMISQGSWMIRSFYDHDNAANFGWAMLPYYDANGNGQADESERCSIYNGLGWAASADTKNPDAAWSLIEWFGTKEMQLKQSELGVTMAAYEGCSDAFVDAFPGMDISPFLQVEEEGTLIFRPYSKYTSRWSNQYQQELVAAWQDPSVTDSVLDNLAAEMNDLLARE
ncbi:MAG: sugar ABC transporter substrate-binding protein [Oscillibacter sp.]|nr:sugar ABC transporter substrate-binding protein [Oscillibacter sp.]